MGGTTIHNDAPMVSITLSGFKMSEKEITNKEYLDFLNSAYLDSWIEVVQEQIIDPCGKYSEYFQAMIKIVTKPPARVKL